MWAAILFCCIALISLPAALASRDPLVIVSWFAQTFLQLVLLPIIMVGQSALEKSHRKSHDIHKEHAQKLDKIIKHLDAHSPQQKPTVHGKPSH